MSLIDTGDVLLVITGAGDVTRQRQAVAKAELLEAIVEYSDDAIMGLTLGGIVTSWNPAAERMYGYSSVEMIGRSGSLLTPQDRTGELELILDKIKDGRYVEHAETTLVRKDGTTVPVSIAAAPIRSEDGTIVGVSAVHRDVTEQRQASAATQRLAEIVENSRDAIIGRNLNGAITSWNAAAERMSGYSRDEVIGTSADFFTPEGQAKEVCDFTARIKTGQPVAEFETVRVRKDGKRIPVSITVSPIVAEDGEIVGASTISRDLTELKHAALYARSLLEAALDPLVTISLEGRITDVNEATVKATGVPRNKLIGTNFSEYFTDPGKAHDGYEQVLAQGSVTDYPLTLRHRDGTQIDVLFNASVYRDFNDEVLGVFAAARDVTDQKKVFEVTQRLASIVEGSDDAIISSTLDGVITSWNPAAERLYGYSSQDIIGKSIQPVTPADRAGEIKAILAKVGAGEPVEHFETFRIRKNGTVFPASLTVSPLRDADGTITGASVISRDVTEQKREEQAVEQARDLLRATMDSLMDPHVLFEAVRDERGQIVDFRFADANPAACAYDGIAYQDLVGSRMLEHYLGVVGAGLLKQYAHVVETGQPLRLDDVLYSMETMGGQDRYLDISAARVGDGLSYTWRDVTDRQVAAARLAESQDRYRLLAENASDVVFMAGSDRRIVWIAPSVTAVLGWDPEELVGTQLADLFRSDFKIASAQDRVELYTKGHDVGPEGGFLFELRTKSGGYRWVSGHEHPLADPDRTPAGVAAGLRDVTDLVKARQEAQGLSDALKASNDSLRDFVAVASHDLRSPLVTIAGFTKILTDNWGTLSDEARLKQLGAIGRGVDRLSRLTDDLLTSAKVEGAVEQARPEHIRLATALAGYLQANREELGTVAVTCPAELVAVVDPSHLTRILDNYVGNAFKYGEPPICIEAERVGDFVELRVRDHGPGVPAEFVSRLFTKFDRGDTPATRATQGTGLGLSIVKALAEANHGDASYQRDEPKGGCFVVRLPAAAA